MQKLSRKCKVTNRLIKPVFVILLSVSLLLSGCRGSFPPSEQSDTSQHSAEQDKSTTSVSVTEKSIPDPKAIFESAPENQGKNILSLEDSFSAGGTLCFLYSILCMTDETDSASSAVNIPGSYCLCVLEAPFEQWTFYTFFSSDISPEPGFIPIVARIAGIGDEGIYLSLASGGIGLCGWDGSCRYLEEIAVDSSAGILTLHPAGETLYALFFDGVTNGSFTSYNKQLNPVVTHQNLENKLSGCILGDSEYLWYGFNENQSLTVWDKPNGTQLFSLGNMVNASSDFLLTKAVDKFILADVSGIWTGNGDVPLQKVMSFTENGYVLQEILAINATEDNCLSLVVRFENNLCLLTLEQTGIIDKQIITTVCSISLFDNVVAAFNRQSEKYRVVLVNPYESGDIDAYCRQLQLDLSAGGGPDLIEPWLVDLEGCIRSGFMEPLDDVVESPDDYWPACLEIGKRDGVQYAIPYHVVLSFLVASESLTNGLEAWTLEQMMNAVQNSPAEALQMDFDGLDIVLAYGLTPRDNPAFIDYEAGVSHLTEQPFIRFLEFAKKYSDNLYYTAESDNSEAAGYYLDGRLAVHSLTMTYPDDLLFAGACFQGQEVLVGMPSAQGRGVYMGANQFCLNSNSQCKEGAKEFLRYLISQEGQLKLVRSVDPVAQQYDFFMPEIFSCRKDVTETSLKDYQENVTKKAPREHLGVFTESSALSEKQIEQFRALFEDARPEWALPSEIYDMACEELTSYFAGDCSAEEAAGKLDNRVQLYFDERK